MKTTAAIILLFAFLSVRPAFAEEPQFTPEQEQYLAHAKNVWDSLDRRQGKVILPNGVATLNVPDQFYYLGPDAVEKVLVEIWSNPPGSGSDTLGMLFPAGVTPIDDECWAVTIAYEEDGHVSDEDAGELDYDELLAQMKEETRLASDERVKQGYDSIELVGWAAQPFYDQAAHKLHWAKEIRFGGQDASTLNYNIRVLGREGVLVLNFIAGMHQKAQIDSNVDAVLALAEFNQGSRYEDFDPSVDQIAAYGIGALVAGKVVAKAGILAAALVFAKKFGVLILLGGGALASRLFKRKPA